jgi:hypothetical protein
MKPQYITINSSGDKFYYSDKAMMVLHREDGPAIETVTGSKSWYRDCKLHREDGPAVEWPNGSKEWFVNGKRHRTDGPAIEWADGDKWWYVDGVKLTEAEFKARTAPCNGKKVMVDGIEYTLQA